MFIDQGGRVRKLEAKQSDCLGVYRRTELISGGRFVFKHQERDTFLGIRSAAGANCPASNTDMMKRKDMIKMRYPGCANKLLAHPGFLMFRNVHGFMPLGLGSDYSLWRMEKHISVQLMVSLISVTKKANVKV